MNSDGALTQEERKKVAEFVAGKARRDSSCPVCSENSWTVLGHVTRMDVYTPEGRVAGSYPAVTVVCKNCFYARSFMAVPMGIVPSDEEEATKKDDTTDSEEERREDANG